jgi:hypothetical protein
LSSEMGRLKEQHSKELAIEERRRSESDQALQAQLDEMSKELESTRQECDMALSNLKAAHDGQKRPRKPMKLRARHW